MLDRSCRPSPRCPTREQPGRSAAQPALRRHAGKPALALGLVAAGLAAGLAAAAAAARGIQALLFRTAPTDVVTYAIVVGILGAMAIVAGLVPARRALAIDPIEALRYE